MANPLTFTVPVVGQPHSTEDPKVSTALTQLLSWGNSKVLTTVSTGSHAINWGSVTCSWTAPPSPVGSPLTIPHGLGAVPTFRTAFPYVDTESFGGISIFEFTAPDATNIYIQCNFNGSIGSTFSCPIGWLALL